MRRPVVRSGKRAAYPAYKPSGMEWVGDIPEHWEVRRLKYTASINDEALSKATNPEFEFTYVDIGSVDAVKGIVTTEIYRFEDAPSRARRIVRDGDTIVSTVRTYLRAIAPIRNPEDNLIVSTGFAVVRPRTLNAGYLSYALRSPFFIETVVSRSTGVSYPAINAPEVGNIGVTIPPLEEQRAIAAFLDRETARIDMLIQKKQRQIELLQEKRSALISHAVTKGLDPDAKMKDSGIEWLGEIPEHWRMMPLRSLAKKGYKTFTDGDWIESPYIRDDGIRLIQTGNIGIGSYREQGFRYVDEETFQTFGCTEVLPGDVLICRLADPVGRACLAPDLGTRMITSVDVCILKTDHGNDAKFVVYALSSHGYLSWMSAECRGGTRDRVSRSMLGAVCIQFPPLGEQRAIAAFLDRETVRIDALIEKVEKSIELLREYRTALISATVTGKIDVRDNIEQRNKQFRQGQKIWHEQT